MSKYSLNPSYHFTSVIIADVLNDESIIFPYISELKLPDTLLVNSNEPGLIPSPTLFWGIDKIDADSYKCFLVRFKLVGPNVNAGCDFNL